MDRFSSSAQRGRPVSTVDAARATDLFEHFINAATLKTILGTYRSICDLVHLKPNVFPLFYPKLRANLTSWKAKALWKKFDLRANHKCYARGKLCPNTKVLVIGAGPCGLRTAIEAQFLGAKVVVIEKRDRMSRNNVLHLWPFVIEDLRALGAKKFFGKFCAGAIDHISIRQVQCILLKVALLLGVEVHTEVSFENLIEPDPNEKIGWRAEFKPSDHPVSQYEFDVIIGADGKRNTLQGFKRKEFRGKLAIAITANFINKRTEAEARVQEISGVAFIFNQKFFKELHQETGIDLENIVYYKDDTHYFVMTAKKPSLIDKGVIKQDFADTARLLSPDNVDREALMNYSREAADFSTNYQMPDMEFAVNHYGQPDVAMFDFTSMYAAENASRIIERHGHKLLMILVGDSLLEPFWPTGSGCARGFLSSLDACWAIKAWGSGTATPLEVLAERESIYRLLAQTTPENLNKDCKAYTVDPTTRYPNLNKTVLVPQQIISLYDTDDPANIELTSRDPQPASITESYRKRRRRDTQVDPNTLIKWIKEQIRDYEDLVVEDITTSFKDGRVLCAVLHHYRPDLLDYSAIRAEDVTKNNQLVFDLLEKEIGIPPVMTGEEMASCEVPDYLNMFSYLTLIYETFRGEIPHIKHPKLELAEVNETKKQPAIPNMRTNDALGALLAKSSSNRRRHGDGGSAKQPSLSEQKRNRKRRSLLDKIESNMDERRLKCLEEIESNRADRQSRRTNHRKLQTAQFIKSMQMLQANAKSDSSEPFEDYSLFVYRQTAPDFQDRVKDLERKFTYVPNRDDRLPMKSKGQADEDFAARIKDLEDKWQEKLPAEKKPKDLLRAIGKIQTSDWNIKEIEKKIMENKLGKPRGSEKERVPKWNREQFLARQTKMEKRHLDRQDSSEVKFAELDKNIKHLEQRLKEGSTRDTAQNKVASITEKLGVKAVEVTDKPKTTKKINTKPVKLPAQSGSEYCHFCQKRVYLMERLSTEGRFFHRGCFKCQYCHTTLRMGSYMFDRDGQYGHRFYCTQHYGKPGEIRSSKTNTKNSSRSREAAKGAAEKVPYGVAGVDLLDKVQTPERIEFSNLSTHMSSDQEDSLSQMDEDEWTDRNFGASTAEVCSSDNEEDSSSSSNTDGENDDAYEEVLEEPPTKEGTLRWMERYKQRYSKEHLAEDSDSEDYSTGSDYSSYYENTTEDDGDDTATEGEEEIKARELRKQEVCVVPPVIQTDTGSDTEILSEDSSSPSSSKLNSATEVSTDSEFALDDPTPTREAPRTLFSDRHVTKTRGSGHRHASSPRRVQVKSTLLQSPLNGKTQKPGDIKLEFSPLVPSPVLPKPAPNACEGYALNRTQSTGGIASRVSLELKKKYLLGDSGLAGNIQKSGSVSTLDSKFRSFHTNISDCQKLLKPAAPEGGQFSAKLRSPLSPVASNSFGTSPVKEDEQPVFAYESEGRPRSPPKEIPVVVPVVNWSSQKPVSISTSDSLSSDSDSRIEVVKPAEVKSVIPRLQVQNDAGEILEDDEIQLDSLCVESKQKDLPKSIASEKKSLNEPKVLVRFQIDKGSERPDSGSEQDSLATAMTETELSDWARDGIVSDDLDDGIKVVFANSAPEHVCGKAAEENFKNIISSIDYMDTGEETSSDEKVLIEAANRNNGYMEFVNDDDMAEDSLNPNLNDVIETINPAIQLRNNNFDSQVIDLKPNDLERLKEKRAHFENEEDSLLVIETGTTTEENTSSDVTVKNLADPNNPKEVQNNKEYEEHCQRLQSKVEFGNIRDSIDIRKSKRNRPPPLTPPINPIAKSASTVIYTKEGIKKERDLNQRLVQEMVMNKMKAQNKSLERKKHGRTSFGATPTHSPPVPDIVATATPTKTDQNALKTSLSDKNFSFKIKTPPANPPLSVYSTFATPAAEKRLESAFSLPELNEHNFKRSLLDSAQKMKHEARAKAQLKSNQDFGLSPEEKLQRLREKINRRRKNGGNTADIQDSIESLVLNTERRNSLLYTGDTLTKKRANKRSKNELERTKSVTEIQYKGQEDGAAAALQFCKSDPNLLTEGVSKAKNRDSDRRKSITKLITDLFVGKKKESSSAPSKGGFLARLSPKSKSKDKEPNTLKGRNSASYPVIPAKPANASPPPIPPLPLNYRVQCTDDSSDGELDWRKDGHDSCDTLDSTNTTDGHIGRHTRKAARQAQLKRHRMAQEIQRKLEETDVKTRQLERRGVAIEKALRGEVHNDDSNKEESELLKEWFGLMRNLTELRRYEKQLMVRAQELELEDRHARLQHELRERMSSNDHKTEEGAKAESKIISEMMEIVAKRDSLKALLETERIKYSEEDKDFEEQMLAKGLKLTSFDKIVLQ